MLSGKKRVVSEAPCFLYSWLTLICHVLWELVPKDPPLGWCQVRVIPGCIGTWVPKVLKRKNASLFDGHWSFDCYNENVFLWPVLICLCSFLTQNSKICFVNIILNAMIPQSTPLITLPGNELASCDTITCEKFWDARKLLMLKVCNSGIQKHIHFLLTDFLKVPREVWHRNV